MSALPQKADILFGGESQHPPTAFGTETTAWLCSGTPLGQGHRNVRFATSPLTKFSLS